MHITTESSIDFFTKNLISAFEDLWFAAEILSVRAEPAGITGHSLALPVCLQGHAALCWLGSCQLEIWEGAQHCAALLCAKLAAVPSCEQKAAGSKISSPCTQMFGSPWAARGLGAYFPSESWFLGGSLCSSGAP